MQKGASKGTSINSPAVSSITTLILMAYVFLPHGNNAQEFEEGHNFCDPNPCEYEGICQSTDAGYICTCPEGTTGYNCEINIDDCALSINGTVVDGGPTKCQQFDANATCIDLLAGYFCICTEDYFGQNCDIPAEDRELLEFFPNPNDPNLIKLVEILVQDPTLFREFTPFFINNSCAAENGTKLSWAREDLFLWASFAGQELDMKNELVQWTDPLLGNCFTFGQSGKIYDVADIGDNFGFQSLLELNEDDYLPWIESSSIDVFVQQRNEHIFANSPHFSAPWGSEVQMMLTERNVARLDDVYGECTNSTRDVNTFYSAGIYTIQGCLQSCYQNQVHLVCGCTDPRQLGIAKIPICGLNKAMCVLNVTTVYGDPKTWDSCAKCTEACSENFVDTLWYSTDFPDIPPECWNLAGLALSNCLRASSASSNNEKQQKVQLSVFFKFNEQEEFKETPSQTFNQWLLQFGGITGIIAGFCFISIIEFIFFLYRIFLTFCTNEAVTQDTREMQFLEDEDAEFDVDTEQPIILAKSNSTPTQQMPMPTAAAQQKNS